jgi:cytoskeletal protein CcmA (bactofilin family)
MSTVPTSTSTSANTVKNVLGPDVELKGTLKFSGELTFDGKIEGDISSEGTLNLGDNAVIKGTVDVGSVIVRGKINGNIVAKEKIDIKAKTELFGDIRTAKLLIEEGVTFVGKSDVNPNKISPTPSGRPEGPKITTAVKSSTP